MDFCELCNKPIMEGQARNGMSGNHWDCEQEKSDKAFEVIKSNINLVKSQIKSAITKEKDVSKLVRVLQILK